MFARGTFEPSTRATRGRARAGTCQDDLERGKEEEERGSMAALVAVCGHLGRKKLTHFVKAAVFLTDPGTHAGTVSISCALLWHCCYCGSANWVGGVVTVS